MLRHRHVARRRRCAALALALFTAVFAPRSVRAHDDGATPPPRHLVLLDLGLHVIGAGYQRVVSERVALSVSAGLYDPWTTTDEVGDVRGGYLRLRPYVFLVGEAPRGLWLSPFMQLALVSAKSAAGPKPGGGAAGGLALGYAFLFGEWLHLSLGAGAQYHMIDVASEAASPAFHGVTWHADITLGVAF